MEPALGGPGPLIMNNKQPQPPPPPPPAVAQPPPGAPRAGGGLLPGGKAREFNRNQRKDSEVGASGGEVRTRRAEALGPGSLSGSSWAGFGRGGFVCLFACLTAKGAGRKAGIPGAGDLKPGSPSPSSAAR